MRVAYLEVAAQLLGRLTERSCDLLDLLLVLVELVLVREGLERCALRYQHLVSRLQPALLLDDPCDLIAHDLRKLVAVRHHIRRDGGEEGELFERLLHHRRDARRLDDIQRHRCSGACHPAAAVRFSNAATAVASLLVSVTWQVFFRFY